MVCLNVHQPDESTTQAQSNQSFLAVAYKSAKIQTTELPHIPAKTVVALDAERS